METKLRELMQTVVGDPPRHVTAEAVRHQMLRRRRMFVVMGTAAAVAVLATAIPVFTGAYSRTLPGGNGSPARSYLTQLPAGHGSVYHDSAGWTVDVPPGWHVISFRSSKGGATAAGAQISNVSLPAPTITPGFPIQASGEALPADGVSVVIAADDDPKLCTRGGQQSPSGCQRSYASLPVSFRDLFWGSALGGSPVTGFLWLKADGKALSVTAKFGPDAFSQRWINPVSKAIASLAMTREPASRHG